MRLDDLRYFIAVAEEGHVGRAAHRLGLSQPALTKGIQRLERALKLTLFDRGSRGMTLTTVGDVFFQRVRHLCMGFDDAAQEAGHLHLGNIGTVRIGTSPIYADALVAKALAQLHGQRPGAKAQLSIQINTALLAALRLGDLDLCVNAIEDVAPEGLEQEVLFDDPLYVVMRDQHPLASKRNVQLRDLAQAQWALPNARVLARRLVEARFLEHGLPSPNVVLELDSSITQIASVVRNSDLLAVMSRFSLCRPASQGLVVAPHAAAKWGRNVGIVTRANAYMSPVSLRFIELLRTCAHDAVQHMRAHPL